MHRTFDAVVMDVACPRFEKHRYREAWRYLRVDLFEVWEISMDKVMGQL